MSGAPDNKPVPPQEDGQQQEQKQDQQQGAPEQQQKEDVDGLAKNLEHSAQVQEVDEPDLALRLAEGLRERPEADITTQPAEGTIYSSAATFEELNLSPELLKGLYVEMKFERPSRIQASTLPMILTPPYKDLIAQAHNGSGKTTCFVLSMLSRVDPQRNEPQALCTCPTRELVQQNLDVLQRMARFTGIRAISTASDTGTSRGRRQAIDEQVVIGTHGTLKNWAQQRILSLDNIQILVFDEADDMLKADGFADDSVRLIRNIRKKNPRAQLLLFSATFNDKVRRFAMQIAPSANHVFVAKEELSLDVIKQYNVKCPDQNAKTRVLQEMVFPNCEKLGQTIIFVRTRDAARNLHSKMESEGYKCTSITGDMEKFDRDRVVKEFRDGTTKILIATDVLARGFDVSQVTLVINYDVPTERNGRDPNYDTYMHRIGRSGRFGRKGVAFNLIARPEDRRIMDQIASYFSREIREIEWDDEDTFLEVLKESM